MDPKTLWELMLMTILSWPPASCLLYKTRLVKRQCPTLPLNLFATCERLIWGIGYASAVLIMILLTKFSFSHYRISHASWYCNQPILMDKVRQNFRLSFSGRLGRPISQNLNLEIKNFIWLIIKQINWQTDFLENTFTTNILFG